MASEYNTAPEHLKEITLEEWYRIFSTYHTEQEHRQVRGEQVFNLHMFNISDPWRQKKIGIAIMGDWFDKETGRNRPKEIIRFCRFGSDEDWRAFTVRFAGQFAGDNS